MIMAVGQRIPRLSAGAGDFSAQGPLITSVALIGTQYNHTRKGDRSGYKAGLCDLHVAKFKRYFVPCPLSRPIHVHPRSAAYLATPATETLETLDTNEVHGLELPQYPGSLETVYVTGRREIRRYHGTTRPSIEAAASSTSFCRRLDGVPECPNRLRALWGAVHLGRVHSTILPLELWSDGLAIPIPDTGSTRDCIHRRHSPSGSDHSPHIAYILTIK
ncbi:hypothetical protein B0H19DRAFT_1257990 [Mycena capillaripes]|nr:hypothetical protein B0H19DRAFT_1257990 [Mycena capillaripes]